MRRITYTLLFLFVYVFLGGCKVLAPYVQVLDCDFRVKSLSNTRLAGINIQGKDSFKQLNFMQAGQLTSAYLSGKVPLAFDLNVEARNPNATPAALAQFDWILWIDEVRITSGTNQQEYTIPPNNGTTQIPLQISVDILELMQGETKDALLNFAFNLADASDVPTRVKMQLKPTVSVNGVPITYPGYLDVGTEFGGN